MYFPQNKVNSHPASKSPHLDPNGPPAPSTTHTGAQVKEVRSEAKLDINEFSSPEDSADPATLCFDPPSFDPPPPPPRHGVVGG